MPKKSVFDPYTDWILEHYKDYRNCPELVKALKDNFGLETNVANIKYWFKQRFGMTTVYGRYDFSEEEKEFIKKYYPDHGPEKTAEMINEIFNTNRTRNSVAVIAHKYGIKISPELRKIISDDKCKKMADAIRRDCGTVKPMRVNSKGTIGYFMKVSDGVWKTAATVIWEETNGPIPDGYKLIYLDGDNSHYQLDNLCLVSNKVAYQVQTNKNYQSGEPEIIKTLIKYYELRNALGVNFIQWKNIQKKFERRFDKLIKEE